MSDEKRNEFNRRVGRRIRLARRRRRIKRQELAPAVGISIHRLGLIESGSLGANVVEIEHIASALQLPFIHFLGKCLLCGSDS